MLKHIDKAYYQLAAMLDAGLPILRTLNTLAESYRGRLHKIFSFLENQVAQGSRLNEAMAQKRSVFPPFDITMVSAAEESGNLPDTFKMLADWYELQLKIRRRLIGGFALPVLIFHFAVFIGQVPLVVAGVFTLDECLRLCFATIAVFWLILIGPILLVKAMPRRGMMRLIFDSSLMLIPLLRKPLYHLSISRFCRSFYMLYAAGVPIAEAAKLASNNTGNLYVSHFVSGTSQSISAGRPMHKGLSRRLPLDVISLWETGEESGTLDKTSLHLAKMYEDRADLGFKILVDWLPKIFYFGVAVYMIMLIARNFGMIYSSYGI